MKAKEEFSKQELQKLMNDGLSQLWKGQWLKQGYQNVNEMTDI